MKRKEEIEEEYTKFQVEKEKIDNLEKFIEYIDIGISDTKENKRYCKQEIKENKLCQILAKIRNFFFFIFQEEDESFYDDDNEILFNIIEMQEKYKSFYERIKNIVDINNYKEMYKLVEFSIKYYEESLAYYDYKRDKLEMSIQGIRLYNYKVANNLEQFYNFMENKLNNIENNSKNKIYMIK